jgi:DNA-binding GntR family transcriptional regulator
LAGLIESTRLYYFNQRIANFYTDQNVADARLHHARILEALHRRDADAAMRAVYEDIRVALEIIQARG